MLEMPLIFSDHMVLQRRKPIALWGTASAGTQVHAKIARADSLLGEATATADAQEEWRLTLPAMEAERGLVLTVECEGESVAFRDVLVGEVWIAGGQSNMEYWLHFDAEKERELCKSENPDIRFFDYPEISFEGELERYDFSEFGFWRRCRREELPWFSAVGYYFADKLQASLGIPVGIVGCNWGGTTASCWMDEAYLRGTVGEVWLEDHEKCLAEMDQQDYTRCYLSDPNNIQNHPIPGSNPRILYPGLTRREQLSFMKAPQVNPYEGVIGPLHHCRPGALYELMLKKIAPYTAKGVLWYQGESDCRHPKIYDVVLGNMIRNWRDLWQEELPFLIVQLAPFEKWIYETGETYPMLRACQEKVARTMPGVYLCSSSDSGMRWDIHPKHKRPIGERLALLARGHIYGENILCDAPRLKDARRIGMQAELELENAEGLHIEGDDVQALYVNGQPCPARIQDNTLILDLPEAENWSIEFANTGYYEVNLCNGAGIPAIPFVLELK